jgi:hypothetical protein
VNEGACKARNCCYNELGTELGAPACHHTIPSIHMLNATDACPAELTAEGVCGVAVAYPDKTTYTTTRFSTFTSLEFSSEVRLTIFIVISYLKGKVKERKNTSKVIIIP